MHRTRLPHGRWLRAVIGVWHWISPRHLDRHLDEISWGHNRRDVGHLCRIASVLSSAGRPLAVGPARTASQAPIWAAFAA